MSASLDQPAPQYAPPGPDQRLPTLDEAVDTVLMIAGRDDMIDPTEQVSIQRMMSGLQAIADQKSAMAAADPMQGPGDGTEDFGAQEGNEPQGGADPLPDGVQYAGSGY